jgi:NnrS protein
VIDEPAQRTGHAVAVLALAGPSDLALSLMAAASFLPAIGPAPTALRVGIRLDGRPELIEVGQSGRQLEAIGAAHLSAAKLRKIAAWLVSADLDLRPFYQLGATHPIMGPVASSLRGLKPLRPASLFEMLIIAITEQQLSLAAAFHIRQRLVERFGSRGRLAVRREHRSPTSPRSPFAHLSDPGLPALLFCGRNLVGYRHGAVDHHADHGIELPSRFDPLSWHNHEMLFGFVMAAIAGFILTAIPNWTGRLPVSGLPLAALAGLWLLGRIACLNSALMPAWLAIATNLSFPVLLVAVIAREIIVAKNWRNLPLVAPVTFLGIANLLMHLEADGVAVPSGLGWRLGLAATIVLISVVAGRILPSFTRNWLAKRLDIDLPAGNEWIDRAALSILHIGLFSWALFPAFRAVGALLLLGAAFNLWRLLRWHGSATVAEPLLLILISAMLGLCWARHYLV